MSNTTELKNKKFRNWCFTSFTFNEEELEKFLTLPCTYVVVGEERCPKTGRMHYQGYFEYKNARYFHSLKSQLGFHVHLEPRRQTAEQAANYCKKDGKFHERGVMSKPQGARTDLANVKDMIEEGKSLEEIIDEHPSYQVAKFTQLILPYKEPKRTWMPVTKWFHGVSGSGKTWAAFTEHPDLRIYVQDDTAQWWDGYDGHEVVIIDDFRQDFCKFSRLLKLLDRYPCRVQCKGGSRQFRPKYIYITSPEHPSFYFTDVDERKDQLNRRIAEVRHFPKKYIGPEIDLADVLSQRPTHASSADVEEEADGFKCSKEVCKEGDQSP